MACSSLVALPRVCSTDGIVGGLQELHMIAFADLAPVSGSTLTYAQAAPGGIVNQIGLQATKKFIKIDILKSTSGLEEVMTKDYQKGSLFFTQKLNLILGGNTVINQAFIQSVLSQPVVIIVKSRTGLYFVAGLTGQFELDSLTGGSGVAEADLNGFSLGFGGVSTTFAPMVDPTILSTIFA